MNERIRELMAQAGFDPASIERMGVMPNAEKFAELIIRECADIADQGYASDNFGNGVTGKQILNWFGG